MEGFQESLVEPHQLQASELNTVKFTQLIKTLSTCFVSCENLITEETVIPVSYTHLDVYKRQELTFLLKFLKWLVHDEVVGDSQKSRS